MNWKVIPMNSHKTEHKEKKRLKITWKGTSLAVQWLRLHASTAGGTGRILGWGSSACPTVWPKKKKGQERVVKRYRGLKTGILKKENWGNGREASFQDIKDDNFLKLRHKSLDQKCWIPNRIKESTA